MQDKKRIAPRTIAYRVLANGCWRWEGHVGNRGYGQLCIDYKRFQAHRWYWENAHGKIPKHLQVHHKCGYKLCVNPDHMQLVNARGRIEGSHSFVDPAHGGNIQRRKTHCPQGHPYTPINTRINNGRRHCVICHRKQNAEYARRKRHGNSD